MQGKAAWAAFTKYVSSLVLTILAPLQWLRTLKIAGRHQGLDRNARKKVFAGIVAGLALAAVAVYVVVDFQDDATQGVYETLSGRLSTATGNDAYNAAVQDRDAAFALIETADRKIAEAQEAGDEDAERLWQENRATYIAQYNNADANVSALTPNHQLWLQVNQILLVERDDDAAKQLIDQRGAIDHPNMDANAASAFEKKDETIDDMTTMLVWFVYPGLIGVLWAPVAFAAGHVLKTTYVPSESVGFKPYPGGAAALFLLLGAFGVPALFFAAWVMQDFADRTETGQISL